MTETLRETQIALEKESSEISVARFNTRHKLASERGDSENTDLGRLLVSSTIKAVSTKIDELTGKAKSGQAGRKTALGKYLLACELETEEIAFLALRALVNRVLISRKEQVTDASVSSHIASRLFDELFLRNLKKDKAKLLKRWKAECDQRSLTREKAREFIRRQARNLELGWQYVDADGNEWDDKVQLKVGRMLLEAIIESTNIAYLKMVQVTPKHRKKLLYVTPEFEQFMESASDLLKDRASFYMPMVVEPEDWSVEDGLYGGGYLTDHIRRYPLVKGANKDWLDEIVDNDPEVLINAVNAVQKTGWRINTKVLEALKHVYELDKGMAGLPRASIEELPAAPEEYDKDYRRECWQVHERNRRQLTSRLFVNQVVWLGEKFSEFDTFYYPHDLDSRGRAYPKPAFLNPQGPDFCKGLLEFSEGKPLGSEAAAAWLAVHVANCWGEDKLALDDRIAWTQNNSEMICEIAENPLDDLRWTKADSPFQFLQAAIYWQRYEAFGLDAVVHCPIHIDATCSGLQHYSAMLLDKVGGRAVNLMDLPDRQDVYQDVADVTVELMKKDLGTDNNNLAEAWLEFGVSRSTTKRSVMVVPYAATFIACFKYTRDAVEERLANGEELPWVGEHKDFHAYGAKKIWQAIEETVVAASDAMRWISKAASQYAKAGNLQLKWGTPSGMVVWHKKPNLKPWRMDTILDGSRIRMQARSEDVGLDNNKMASSTPPSFVHSLDAAHMCLSIDAATFQGMKDFAVVHDSFATHACDMEVFSACVRDTFHEMYTSQDILQGLRDIIQEGVPEELDPLPSKGELDLEEVRTSTFFFS